MCVGNLQEVGGEGGRSQQVASLVFLWRERLTEEASDVFSLEAASLCPPEDGQRTASALQTAAVHPG